jgi:hypothetical protein
MERCVLHFACAGICTRRYSTFNYLFVDKLAIYMRHCVAVRVRVRVRVRVIVQPRFRLLSHNLPKIWTFIVTIQTKS